MKEFLIGYFVGVVIMTLIYIAIAVWTGGNNVDVEIGTALTCEQVSGVVVCVER